MSAIVRKHESTTWIGIFIVIALFTVGTLCGAPRPRRNITMEDCVRTRRIGYDEHPLLAVAPNGHHVAYVVKAPNLRTNRNDYTLYVRALDSQPGRFNGKRLARYDKIAGLHWLGDGKHLALLAQDWGHASIELVDVVTGTTTRLPVSDDIASYSVDSAGQTYVFAVRVSRITRNKRAQQEKYGFPVSKGTVIDLENSFPDYKPIFKIYVLKRSESGWSRRRVLLTSELGTRTGVFEGVTGVSLSPNGRYFTFSYVPDEIPLLWEESCLTKWLTSRGFRPEKLVLYEVEANQGRIGFNAPETSPFRTVWSEDSKAFSIVSIAPSGSLWEKRDVAAGFHDGAQWASYSHLYTVDISTGNVAEVLFNLPSWNEHGVASWSKKDGPMLLHFDAETFAWMRRSGTSWKETSRFRFSIPEVSLNSGWSANGRMVVGLREGLMTPPDLALYHVNDRTSRVLTDLNPAYRGIEMGMVEPIEWHDKYGEPCSGFLVKPVGYISGHRYPLVVMSKGWVSNFFYTDTFHRTAFVPQPLAAAGFVVLLATRPSYVQDFRQSEELSQYPGQLAEAYRWMAMVESGIDFLDQRGIVDQGLVGIVGFSRTSWYVDFMLTHSDFRFAAASSADSGLYNYGGYWLWNARSIADDSDAQMGGPPYGKTRENWLKYSPAFNADHVSAPLLMEYTKETSVGPIAAYEFFTALYRQGKPVELVYYPKGEHELDTPWERVASLRRNLDWFRFWLQGYQGTPPSYDRNQYLRWRMLRERRAKGAPQQMQVIEKTQIN